MVTLRTLKARGECLITGWKDRPSFSYYRYRNHYYVGRDRQHAYGDALKETVIPITHAEVQAELDRLGAYDDLSGVADTPRLEALGFTWATPTR